MLFNSQGLIPVPTVQRLYQFASEVWSSPADSAFNLTKVITVKTKYMLLNNTGLDIEYKQLGAPDPAVPYGVGRRCAGTLRHEGRVAVHWDNRRLPLELVVRPAGEQEQSTRLVS